MGGKKPGELVEAAADDVETPLPALVGEFFEGVDARHGILELGRVAVVRDDVLATPPRLEPFLLLGVFECRCQLLGVEGRPFQQRRRYAQIQRAQEGRPSELRRDTSVQEKQIVARCRQQIAHVLRGHHGRAFAAGAALGHSIGTVMRERRDKSGSRRRGQ